MAKAKRTLSRNDLELKTARLIVVEKFIPYVGWAIVMVATAYPISFLMRGVHDIAGKTTNFNAVISVSVAINIAIGVSYAVQRRRLIKQGKELERLRGRSSEREERELGDRGIVRAPSGNGEG